MAEKMDLIVAGPASHVLAVVLRQDMAGPTPDAALLVGSGLPLRDGQTGDVQLRIVPEHLKVATVDRREDVMLTPRLFSLVEALPEEGAAPHANPLALNGATITANLPAAAAIDTPVWVYIEGAAQPIVQQLQVPSGSAAATEPLQLPSGAYAALVLAAGVRAALVSVTVP